MNNSFARLIDGACATLRTEVLPRLEDEFARGQVFGVINLLNTLKVRADWSASFLLQQLAAQKAALDGVAALLDEPASPALPVSTPIAELLAMRDEGNRRISTMLARLDAQDATLVPGAMAQAEALLRQAMRAEVEIELRNAPRPLFAEMSSGHER
jgi:hypothetical protein